MNASDFLPPLQTLNPCECGAFALTVNCSLTAGSWHPRTPAAQKSQAGTAGFSLAGANL
jgi:hypothetical protein